MNDSGWRVANGSRRAMRVVQKGGPEGQNHQQTGSLPREPQLDKAGPSRQIADRASPHLGRLGRVGATTERLRASRVRVHELHFPETSTVPRLTIARPQAVPTASRTHEFFYALRLLVACSWSGPAQAANNLHQIWAS